MGEWVATAERLPEPGVVVEVAGFDFLDGRVHALLRLLLPQNVWQMYRRDGIWCSTPWVPQHWRPLSEPTP